MATSSRHVSGCFSRDECLAVLALRQPAVRAGANARIFAIAPVEQVVARFLSRCCVVRDLVGGQSRPLGQFLCQVVEIGGAVVGGRHQASAFVEIEIGRAGLDGELVERHVALLLAQRDREFVAPLGKRLAGARIDHVEGHAGECLRREAESGKGFLRRMLAAQCLEVGIVQCLNADRDAVDARCCDSHGNSPPRSRSGWLRASSRRPAKCSTATRWNPAHAPRLPAA